MVLEGLQEPEEVREAALRPAADPPRAQGGLPLSPQRHERALSNSQKAVSSEVKVQALRVEWSALVWMAGRQKPPSARDKAEQLPGLGAGNVGSFWDNCKSRRPCGRTPYDRLLTHPVLRADYRIT